MIFFCDESTNFFLIKFPCSSTEAFNDLILTFLSNGNKSINWWFPVFFAFALAKVNYMCGKPLQ